MSETATEPARPAAGPRAVAVRSHASLLRSAGSSRALLQLVSDRQGEFSERDRQSAVRRSLRRQFVVAATHVLDECA